METKTVRSKGTHSKASYLSTRSKKSGSLISAPAQNSAFSKIYSFRSIKANLLPAFMQRSARRNGLNTRDLRLFTLSTLELPVESHWVPSEPEELKCPTEDRISQRKICVVKNIQRMLEGSGGEEEFLMETGGVSIYGKHIVSFSEGGEAASAVIDAYMYTLKSSCSAGKVAISTCEFSNEVFVKGRADVNHTHGNILNNEYLLFPIFEDYWRLVIVNVKERIVSYYDPIKEHQQINKFLSALFSLIRNYLLQYENAQIEETIWRDLHYRPTKSPRVFKQDSAVFLCRQAYAALTGQSLDALQISSYKQDVIISLIQCTAI